jgi:hypothetical protein
MSDYTPTGNPVAESRGVSSQVRAEFTLVQTAFNTKANATGQVWTGVHDFTGATTTVATPLTASAAATKAYCDGLAFSTALPNQTGNSGKFVTTNGTVASWAAVTPPSIVRSARTSNTILDVSDSQSLVDITSGTFSQTFTAVATLGSGWFCYIRNSGTGDITLDPNASETIDGLTSYVMYPGECRLVQCSGTAFTTVVVSPFYKSFTASGTFTKPPGYLSFGGFLWGGGGSGGKASTNNGAGGGGGACNPLNILASALSATTTVTLGAGGLAKTVDNTSGSVGGTSTFSSFSAYGGGGGSAAGFNYSGGGGGGVLGAGSVGTNQYGTGGDPTTPAASGIDAAGLGGGHGLNGAGGMSGWGGAGGGGAATGAGGKSVYGGGGGGASSAGVGGVSLYGGSGGAGVSASSATAGSQPGGGGGGTATGTSSGAGGAGQLNIWGIA